MYVCVWLCVYVCVWLKWCIIYGLCILYMKLWKKIFLWLFLIFTVFWHSGQFFTLFWPLVRFGVKFLYITICTFINCANMPKIALINTIIIMLCNFSPNAWYFVTLHDVNTVQLSYVNFWKKYAHLEVRFFFCSFSHWFQIYHQI